MRVIQKHLLPQILEHKVPKKYRNDQSWKGSPIWSCPANLWITKASSDVFGTEVIDTQSIFSSEAWIDSDVLLADIGFEMFWIGLAHIFVRIVWRESWYKKAFIFILYYHICNVLPESIPSRFWCLWAGAGGAHLERQEGHVWDSLKHRKIVASFFAMPK